MSGFGDFDPEDAYDAGDDPDDRLNVIARTIVDLRARRLEPRFDGRRADLRRVVEALEHAELDDDQAAELVELRAELEAL